MSIYFFLYLIVSFLLIYVGNIFYNKYKNIGGLFFLLFTIFISIWFILFFFTYLKELNLNIILWISRLTYGFSILATYSLLGFILYFDNLNKQYKLNIFIKLIIIFIIGFSLLTFFSPYIIDSLYYNIEKHDYYEKTGGLFNLYIVLESLFFPIFLYYVFKKYNGLFNINKIRFKYILIGIFLFGVLIFSFQLVLPYFGIYLLEKEAILFILPFLFFTWYSITRYYFTDLTFRYKDILSFILSIGTTIFLFIYIKYINIYLGHGIINYSSITNNFNYIELSLGIIIYLLFFKFFNIKISGSTEYKKFILILNKMKEVIPFVNNFNDLNKLLAKESKLKFNIENVKIILFNSTEKEKKKELYHFFKNNLNADIFINDIVFIEENKNKFKKNKILKELNKEVAIIFPMINNKGDLIGIFELGNKPLKEHYYSEEINIIKDFVNFLVGHIKYIDIYSEINNLNINLDKKVDEKTIEYNALISKQREFISMSSHEIKTPVMGAALHIKNFLDDIELGNYDKKYLIEEGKILEKQIFKISDLTKNIFSVQKYEIKNIGLYIEKVKLKNIIISEYEILSRIYPNIYFDINIGKNIGYIDIDKIQFTQVISNLLHNAIKFANKEKPIIKIIACLKGSIIELVIEDNGKGFKYGDEKDIFEKYSTGNGKSVGIGMGLYLCKKIVELHGGSIIASNAKNAGGAQFKILLSKE